MDQDATTGRISARLSSRNEMIFFFRNSNSGFASTLDSLDWSVYNSASPQATLVIRIIARLTAVMYAA